MRRLCAASRLAMNPAPNFFRWILIFGFTNEVTRKALGLNIRLHAATRVTPFSVSRLRRPRTRLFLGSLGVGCAQRYAENVNDTTTHQRNGLKSYFPLI
jgi:hypothetical protein